jgi:hypothetical protein
LEEAFAGGLRGLLPQRPDLDGGPAGLRVQIS